jgi:hypothetical protein
MCFAFLKSMNDTIIPLPFYENVYRHWALYSQGDFKEKKTIFFLGTRTSKFLCGFSEKKSNIKNAFFHHPLSHPRTIIDSPLLKEKLYFGGFR